MATLKLLLLIAILPGQHSCMTPPNERPPSGELRKQTAWELAIPRAAALFRVRISVQISLHLNLLFFQVFFWLWTLSESVMLFAATDYCPSALSKAIINHLVRSDDPQRALTQIGSLSPTFIAGSLLSIMGGLLRTHCYRTLGKMFTFELSIRKEHKLITSGVYGIVRHPGYTGGISVLLGFLLCSLSRHSWLVAFSLLALGQAESMMANVLGCAWISMFVMFGVGLVRRMNDEDVMLEQNFGKEWKEWAERVPWRLVPWVY
jgi:protein-S-isoprenylcysteine O-methyltransferase Ste14